MTLLKLIRWDLQLQIRYNIITAALVVTLFYILLLANLSFDEIDKLLVFFIFSDPSMLGFLFTGVIVLYEKNAHVLDALNVTPLKIGNYLFSKAISLSLSALVCSFGMAITYYN